MTSDISENGPAACFSLGPLILFVNQSTFLIGACLIRLYCGLFWLGGRPRKTLLQRQPSGWFLLFIWFWLRLIVWPAPALGGLCWPFNKLLSQFCSFISALQKIWRLQISPILVCSGSVDNSSFCISIQRTIFEWLLVTSKSSDEWYKDSLKNVHYFMPFL